MIDFEEPARARLHFVMPGEYAYVVLAPSAAPAPGVQRRPGVENAPLLEMQMTELSRGYESSKETYRKLLDKSEQAQQAENLERRQKGEQFRLIDPARVPEKPIKPNVPKVLFAGFALGIFFGAGLAIVREFMDRSFRNAKDMEAALGIKVLASSPRFEPKSV